MIRNRISEDRSHDSQQWVLATCFAEEDEGKVETIATAKVEEVEDF